MSTKELLPLKILNECFTYDGINLIWKERPKHHFIHNSGNGYSVFNAKYKNKIAGAILKNKRNNLKYVNINLAFGGRRYQYLAHRIIWAIHHNKLPSLKFNIDHIDGNGLNNKISNLRLVTQTNNLKNLSMRSINTTGVTGVSFRKDRRTWTAFINDNNKKLQRKSFKEFFEACCWRKSMELKYNYHVNHGRKAI